MQEKVRITNQPMGVMGILSVIFITLLFLHGCTDACGKTENAIQCGGFLAKQIEVEIQKGYNSAEKR